jgi:hypothetical protein
VVTGSRLWGTSPVTALIGSWFDHEVSMELAPVVNLLFRRKEKRNVPPVGSVGKDILEMQRILWTQKQEVGPTPRCQHAIAYDNKRGRTVLFGGTSATGAMADTWEWDGQNWTQMAEVGPSPRSTHGMVFDSQRNQTVLFAGGFWNNPYDADTWAWDGENWTQLADTGPPGRNTLALAYDSQRQRTVLFGGAAHAGSLGDTWEWDGGSWTQKEIIGPSGRSGAMMAYDSIRGRTVLFGGADANGNGLGDTWEWDGSAWAQKSDFGATASAYAALAFKGDSVSLFGGALSTRGNVSTIYPNTWTWDGRLWTLRQYMGPGTRYKHAMAYDSKRGCLVLFGGLCTTPTGGALLGQMLGDTWEHSETN